MGSPVGGLQVPRKGPARPDALTGKVHGAIPVAAVHGIERGHHNPGSLALLGSEEMQLFRLAVFQLQQHNACLVMGLAWTEQLTRCIHGSLCQHTAVIGMHLKFYHLLKA